ncbi:MAG: AAA family ATPase [Chloroflexi bacterium]|nr:AAA family ATPase [Chloroflexota bacterium]
MAKATFQVGGLIENRYRVLSIIETGGMGVLYHVSDEAQDGEIVALKTVRLDVPTAEVPQRVEHFQREFQILTQLRHPNLVSVYEFGITTEGEIYFTLEWIEGPDLESGRHSLKPDVAIPIVVQICRALAYLHARGVIHGDLKLANILLLDDAADQRHQVKIVDFGLAGEVTSLETRARYYTPGYSAPEVREQCPIDHRSDLYSLGAVWYALLVGESPIFMFGAERLIQIALDEALKTQEQIPAALGRVIARLLATSPDERYTSANEVIQAVNKITGSTYKLETRETASSYALRGRFVGRDAEMVVLQELWQQAQSTEGKLVLVSGEAGVGKTRLLEEFVVQAGLEGARVARGQCVEGAGIAYRPWREVLRVLIRYVEGVDPSQRADLDIGRVGAVLATLFPELWERDYMTDIAPPAELEPQAAQQRLNNAIAQMLQAAARLRPTVVVVEDAHWADEATLALLNFLALIPGQSGLLVCVTYRPKDIGPDHPLIALAGDRVQRIPIQHLSPDATIDLVSSMLGLEELSALLTERVSQITEGNAFFVQELIRSLAKDGVVLQRTVTGWHVNHTALQETRLPESIRQVVWNRLEHLAVETRQVLQWAAVVGQVFWDGVVEEIGPVARAQVQAALAEGVEQELILKRDTLTFKREQEYIFVSPTVRETSYQNISLQERQKAHGRVARWLIAHSGDKDGEHLGLIADHLEGAGEIEQAVIYLHQAGEQAAVQFANVEAIAYFGRALDLVPPDDLVKRYDLLLAREKVCHLHGIRETEAQDVAELQKLAEALDDDGRRTEAALRRARHAEAITDYPATIAALQEVIALAQATRDVYNEAMGYQRWGEVLWNKGDYEAGRLQLEQALILARSVGAREIEAGSLNNIGITFWFQGDYAQAGDHFEHALHIYREIGDLKEESKVLNNLGIVSSSLGDYASARTYFDQALRISRDIGDRRADCTALNNVGHGLYCQGAYAQAKEYLTEGLRISQDIGDRVMQGYLLMTLGRVLIGLECFAEATDTYQQASSLRKELGQSHLVINAIAGLAYIAMLQDDLTQAQTLVEEILRHNEARSQDGSEESFWIYLTCYRILRANLDPRAETILDTAYHLLQEQAAKITDEEMRCSFLENVAIHREIVREWMDRQINE